MEKAPGIELEEVWPKMEIQDRLAIVKSLLGFQNAWTSASFNGYGGLYYTDDLDEPVKDEPLYVDANGNEIKNPKFAIGPTTGREWLDNGRATIKMDRGPCKPSVSIFSVTTNEYKGTPWKTITWQLGNEKRPLSLNFHNYQNLH